MTRPRHRAPLLLVLVVVAGLAGCAQEAAKTSSPATAATETPAPAPPAPVTQEPPPAAARPATPLSPGVVIAVAPSTVPPPDLEDFVDHPAIRDVFFESGRADIGRQGSGIMGRNVRWLLDNPDYLLLVEGHSDHTGLRDDNLVIAQRRAASAVSFLLESGVPTTRLHTVSWGSERPACRDKTGACAAKNRRVHFRVKRQ